MAATIPISDEGGVTYQELVDLERDFDDVETEIIRHQHSLTIPLYTRRAEILSRIPNFWPLVFEAAPPDIDEFIQPSDSALLLASLNALSVSRFELEADPKNGDPRNVAIRFDFSENDYFEDKVLEKKFWFRRGGEDEDWSGLVSEPVEIKWKKGKDLTNGLLGMVRKVWEKWAAEAKSGAAAEKTKGKKKEKKALSAEEQALQTKMSETALGGLSFFAWFGYVGPRVTAEESKAATTKRNEERRLRKEGKEVPEEEDEEEDEEMDEDDEDDDEDSLEIFPEGEGLALAITEDLWPSAIKYFTQAQEQVMSDVDFESDLEEGDGAEDDDEDEPPALKKRKV